MKKLILLFILLWPLAAKAQPLHFEKDSISTVSGEVVFKVRFTADLSEQAFHSKAFSYLNDELDPYLGEFRSDNDAYTDCQLTDYVGVLNGLFQKFGMYMSYRLQMRYGKGNCVLIIRDIYFMDKGYYGSDIDPQQRETIRKYSAREIMIDRGYSLMFIRNVSERITEASLERINEIITGLYVVFNEKE